MSFADLDSWSNALAERVLSLGDPRERRIGILCPAGFEFAAALLGIWKAGAIAVPLQPAHPEAELQFLVGDAELSGAFIHNNCLALAEKLPLPEPISLSFTKRPPPPSDPDPASGALMIYTSGTTSRPRGVITTHSAVESQIECLLSAWGWSESDRTLNILPLHHVHGLINILACSLMAGAQCELHPKFSPELVWNRIAGNEINVFMAVPTIYAKLAQHWEKQDPATQKNWSLAASQMRLMVSGSAALPTTLSNQWHSITRHRLLERYGMTEIGMALSNPYEGERRVGTVGKPLPGVGVRLEAGEIQVRGKNIFREYWKRPEGTASSFTADGWFRTGDIAELDEDGYFRILGRASQDILKSGGFKISALEVESAILENPKIEDIAVLGVADPDWGERVAAVYVGNEESAALSDWLKQRIAHYKVPSLWLRLPALPKNAMGKTIKSELRALFGGNKAQ